MCSLTCKHFAILESPLARQRCPAPCREIEPTEVSSTASCFDCMSPLQKHNTHNTCNETRKYLTITAYSVLWRPLYLIINVFCPILVSVNILPKAAVSALKALLSCLCVPCFESVFIVHAVGTLNDWLIDHQAITVVTAYSWINVFHIEQRQ